MGSSEQVALNGTEVLALVVDREDGLQLRLDSADRERAGLGSGQRLRVRRFGRTDERAFVAAVVERPPWAWVVLDDRVRAVR